MAYVTSRAFLSYSFRFELLPSLSEKDEDPLMSDDDEPISEDSVS
jgi:hypothetical protein